MTIEVVVHQSPRGVSGCLLDLLVVALGLFNIHSDWVDNK